MTTRVLVLSLLSTALLSALQRSLVVLSTDVGNEIDDQWAITAYLLQPRFEVSILSPHSDQQEHPPLIEGGSTPPMSHRSPERSLSESARWF